MASANFGRQCDSNLHHIFEDPDALCMSSASCKGATNFSLLVDYLDKTTDWDSVWDLNPIGGWVCREGRLQHGSQPKCCCGDSRSEFFAGMLFNLTRSLSNKDRTWDLMHDLDLAQAISNMATVFQLELKEYIADRYQAYKTSQRTAGEAEGVDSELELHALAPLDYARLVDVLDTKVSYCYDGCGCSTGSGSSEQEPLAKMDVDPKDETDGGEPVDVPSQESNLDPKPAGEGLKLGEETLAAVPTGEQPEGTLSVDQGSLTLPGCSKDLVLAEVKTLVEGLLKKNQRGRGAVKRTITGEVSKPTAPRIYTQKKSGQVPLCCNLEAIPSGALRQWRNAYHCATPSVQRELLCISEAVRSVGVHRIEDRLAIVPIDFYESPKEVLLARGDHLVRRTWEAKSNARSSSSRTAEPKAKSPRLERRQTTSRNRSSKGSDQEKIYSTKTYHSKAFSNVDLAKERNLAAKSSKKNSSYSKGESTSKKKSVPSATVTSQSTESREGTRGKTTGSAKNKERTQGVVSISRSEHLLRLVDKVKALNVSTLRVLGCWIMLPVTSVLRSVISTLLSSCETD